MKNLISIEKEIREAGQCWMAAVQSGVAEDVVAFYADDAVLLGALANDLKQHPDHIRTYFEMFCEMDGIQGKFHQQCIRAYDNMAINSGKCTFSHRDRSGNVIEIPARFTFVYQYHDGEWRIVEHHSSKLPG